MELQYLKLEDEDNLLPNNTKWKQEAGALLHIAMIIRPFYIALNILSGKNKIKPREKYWNQVRRSIRYLKTNKDLNLVIILKTEPILTSFNDADRTGGKTDRKSSSGNLFLLDKSPIQWITKKQ